MSWLTQLQQVCGSSNVSEVTMDSHGDSRTLPWADVVEEEQLRSLLELAAAESRRLLPAGAGEHLPGAALARTDALVSLRRRDQVVDYEAADLTMVAQCGATLRQLDAVVAAEHQSLAVDCARGKRATLGGAVSGNRLGLDGLRFGNWRDHVLGARVMHADGSVTQTGSRVVKSVSGYDLAKLYVGSQGSMVFLLDINLRLLSRLQTTKTVRASLPYESVAEALEVLHENRSLQPSSLLVIAQPHMQRPAGHVDVVARFAGREEVVAQQVLQCQQATGGQVLADDAAELLAHQLRQQSAPVTGKPCMRVLALPVGILSTVLDCAPELDAQSGFVAQYGIGVATFVFSPETEPALRHLQKQIDPAQARFVWANMQDHKAPKGATSTALVKLQRSIHDSFDAHGILAGGETW